MSDCVSKTCKEALLYHLVMVSSGRPPNGEIEIIDTDMRNHAGMWRAIFWFRWKKYGRSIFTAVIHEVSVVEIIPDGPIPTVPQFPGD